MPDERLHLADRLALRPKEAAEALGISQRTLRDWMRNEALPYAHVGNVILIRCDDLCRWLKERVEDGRQTDALVGGILDGLK